MNSISHGCSVAALVVCGLLLARCDEPQNSPPPPAPKASAPTTSAPVPIANPTLTPAPKVACTNTEPKSQAIKCDSDDCGKLEADYCVSPFLIEAKYPNPVSADPKYKVYWGPESKWSKVSPPYPAAIEDWFDKRYCVLQADAGKGVSSFGLIGGYAPVLAGRRVRAASDGTQFATQVDEAMGVERVVALIMASGGKLTVNVKQDAKGGAANQSDQSLLTSELKDYYILVPLDNAKPSAKMPFKPNPDTAEAEAARKFRDQMNVAQCKTGLRSWFESLVREHQDEFKEQQLFYAP